MRVEADAMTDQSQEREEFQGKIRKQRKDKQSGTTLSTWPIGLEQWFSALS